MQDMNRVIEWENDGIEETEDTEEQCWNTVAFRFLGLLC